MAESSPVVRQQFLSKCSSENRELLKVYAEWPRKVSLSSEMSEKVDRIQKIHKKVNQTEMIKEILAFFKKNKKKKDIKIKDFRSMYAKISKLRPVLWQRVFLIQLSALKKNQFWAEDLMKDIVSMAPITPSFDYSISRSIETEMLEFLDFHLAFIEKELRSEMIKKMYYSQLLDLSGNLPREKLPLGLFVSWSLGELRELVKNPYYSVEMRSFLFGHLEKRSTKTEAQSILNQVGIKSLLDQKKSFSLWAYTYFLPPKKELREAILDRLQKAVEGRNSYLHYFLLHGRSSQTLLSKLKEKSNNPLFSKAIFQAKREFYWDQLGKGKGASLYIFKLLKLGETSEELFWHLFFHTRTTQSSSS